jgi:hypothetical protein
VTLLLAGVIVALSSARSSSVGTPLVSLSGSGSWGSFAELTAWQDALYGSPDAPKVDLNYVPHGTLLGREEFLAGNTDFVISGQPFTADELKTANKTSADMIDAPISVSSLAFVFNEPVAGFEWVSFKCDPDNPPEGDTTGGQDCFVRTKYNDPKKDFGPDNPELRVPNHNLAAMAFETAIVDSSKIQLNGWRHPDVFQLFGFPANVDPPPTDPPTVLPPAGFSFGGGTSAHPVSVLRSDGDEVNVYLQQFAKKVAPDDVWKAIVKAADPNADSASWPITERLANLGLIASRDGAEQQAAQLSLHGSDPRSGGKSQSIDGVIAPAPAWTLGDLKAKFPAGDQKFEFIALKNASGEWITPTPAAINAAIDAGGDVPLYALNNPSPGAYPLVWVDHLYAPAHGLSLEKTEGLAAVIRYLATAGQSEAGKVGEGRLSPDLSKKALAAADQLVESNCTGADEEVVKSSDPGPFAPDLPELHAIGTMSHCQKKEAPTTTAAAPSATSSVSSHATSPAGSLVTTPLPKASSLGSGESAFAVPSLTRPPTGAATSGSTPTNASGSTTTLPRNELLTAANLPLPVNSGATRGATLATLLLGAGLYLLVRPLTSGALRRGRR